MSTAQSGRPRVSVRSGTHSRSDTARVSSATHGSARSTQAKGQVSAGGVPVMRATSAAS